MFAATSPTLLGLGAAGAPSSRALRKALVENKRNAWRLTNYKVGGRLGVPPLFALDRAGNVIFYHSFNKSTPFGWTMAEEDPEKFCFSYPLQWRAALMRDEALKDKVVKVKVPVIIEPQSGKTEAVKANPTQSNNSTSESSSPSSDAIGKKPEEPAKPITKLEEQTIPGQLIPLRSRKLRLNWPVSFAYKTFYWTLVGLTASIIFFEYLLFRQWLNYPARQGLRQWEEAALERPTQVFDDFLAHPWYDSEQIPESWKDQVDNMFDALWRLGQGAAESFGYNPNHDAQEEARLAALEAARTQIQKEERQWGKWAKYGVVACLTVACLL